MFEPNHRQGSRPLLAASPVSAYEKVVACPTCSPELGREAKFCPQCGFPLAGRASPAPEVEPAARETHAPPPGAQTPMAREPLPEPAQPEPQIERPRVVSCSCGQALPREAQFCLRCGAKVGQSLVRYRLSRKSTDRAPDSVDLRGDELTIGKSGECDMILAGDDFVSRRHARMFQSDGMIFLEDLDILDVVQVSAVGMDLRRLRDDFGDRLAFCGTMCVQTVLPRGTVQDVEAEVRRRQELFPDGGLILGPTNTIEVGTPVENILAMYRAAGSLREPCQKWRAA